MTKQQNLFGNYKYCESCKRPLPMTYKENLCPPCKQQNLFHEVKEYIRANDVTEYDVALHFNIPHRQVLEWIREGRIEYKENSHNTLSMHCAACGAPITFGTLCPKCLRQKNTEGHTAVQPLDPSRMRYLDDVE